MTKQRVNQSIDEGSAIAQLQHEATQDVHDPELVGVPLDLGRAELLPIMERYTPHRRPQMQAARDNRDVVLVGFPRDEVSALASAFNGSGWRTHECVGPTGAPCPLLASDRPCELRAAVDLAAVAIGGDLSLSNAQISLISCAGCPASPRVVVVVREQGDEIQIEGQTATIGGGGRSEAVVGVAEALVTN